MPNWAPTPSRCGMGLAFSTLFSSWLRDHRDTTWRQKSMIKLYNLYTHRPSSACCTKSLRSSAWSGMRIVSHPRLTKYILSSAKPRWMPMEGGWLDSWIALRSSASCGFLKRRKPNPWLWHTMTIVSVLPNAYKSQ
jgi:hypothetical protein